MTQFIKQNGCAWLSHDRLRLQRRRSMAAEPPSPHPPTPRLDLRQSEVGIHERTHAGKATKGRMPQEGEKKKATVSREKPSVGDG